MASANTARISKLCGLLSVVLTLPFTMAAVTPHNLDEGHHRYANMTAEHWQDNNYDQYLRSYPNGNVMTFPQYVDHLSIPERIECGVGKQKFCHISPLGQSLAGPDWYILSATSIWNHYTNSLVHALKQSVPLAKAVAHEVLMDLVYEYNPQTNSGLLNEVELINLLLMPIEHGGNRDPRISEETHEDDWTAAIKPIAQPTINTACHKAVEPVQYAKMKRHLVGNSAAVEQTPIILYNSTKPVETNLDDLGQQLYDMLVQSIDNKINSPISSETGIYSALEHGRFASPNVDPARLAPNAHNIMSLFTISALLNHQNAMVLVTKKSNCSQDRAEFKNDKSRLAFCSSDNTLIEIVTVDGQSFFSDIYNAHLIRDKYGFKTSFLASEALRCQRSIDNAKINQADDDESDEQPFDPCTFRLPICNLVEPEYQHLLQKSGSVDPAEESKNIVSICREVVGLPI